MPQCEMVKKKIRGKKPSKLLSEHTHYKKLKLSNDLFHKNRPLQDLARKTLHLPKKRRKLSQVRRKKVKTRHQKVPCFKRHFVADNLSREYKYYCTDEMSTFQSILQSLNLKNNFRKLFVCHAIPQFPLFQFFYQQMLLILRCRG